MPDFLQIEMLGRLRVSGGHGVIQRFGTRRSALLLAYLAAHRGREHSREALAEMLWPEEDPQVTRVRFRQVLAGLRRNLEEVSADDDLIQSDANSVALATGRFRTDVEAFERLLRESKAATSSEDERAMLLEATSLYSGELLPGLYEDWISLERTRLAGQCGDAWLRLATLALDAGVPADAVDHALNAVRLDPIREESHRALIRTLVAVGRRGDAVRQLGALEKLLREEYGVEPDASLKALLDPPKSNGVTVVETREKLSSPQPKVATPDSLEAVGGAVPPGSPFYVVRPADGEFQRAISRKESIVLVKGPRQVGKTSLLARGLAHARLSGTRVVLSDFQKLTAAELESPDALFRSQLLSWCDQLGLEPDLDKSWSAARSWASNWERFVRREALNAGHRPLLWVLDEVDRLFTFPYGSEVFALFRSWHNERALDPSGPWTDLTLAIGYATEAHLFISDLNQSPFNVGTRLTLEDFTADQVAELNRRHGSVLKSGAELDRFLELVGGHPYLVRRGLYELRTRGGDVTAFCERAAQEEGPMGDHLRRLRLSLSADPDLTSALGAFLHQRSALSPDAFARLRTAGVLAGESADGARPRCGLYASYLRAVLP